MWRRNIVSILACLAIITAGGVRAETRREGGTDGGQQRMVQQLMQQNATLEQEKAVLAAVRDDLKAQLDKLNATRKGDQQALQHAKEETTALNSRFNALVGKHAALQTQARSTQEQLYDAERRNKILNGKIADLAHQKTECVGDNHKLYELNVRILDAYHKKGVADALLQHEPVTGIRGVEAQNIVQKYRDELDVQKIPETGGSRE